MSRSIPQSETLFFKWCQGIELSKPENVISRNPKRNLRYRSSSTDNILHIHQPQDWCHDVSRPDRRWQKLLPGSRVKLPPGAPSICLIGFLEWFPAGRIARLGCFFQHVFLPESRMWYRCHDTLRVTENMWGNSEQPGRLSYIPKVGHNHGIPNGSLRATLRCISIGVIVVSQRARRRIIAEAACQILWWASSSPLLDDPSIVRKRAYAWHARVYYYHQGYSLVGAKLFRIIGRYCDAMLNT